MTPLVSVIVCTYGRAAALEQLLDCLEAQNYPRFEVLVIDGNGEISPALDILKKFESRPIAPALRLIKSPKGLTIQRNAGLREAQGDVICFLDDDISFNSAFLSDVVRTFERPDSADVGGITGYDPLHYGGAPTFRWRLKNFLGAIPSLEPGAVDHLGRAVPLTFVKPGTAYKDVGWLGGFCMIYRRSAVGSLRFDEKLPTYGGEDRDFSMYVGQHWRLLLCGDLMVNHHLAAPGRDSMLRRFYETGFGVGRRTAKNMSGPADYLTVARTFVADVIVDVLTFLGTPSRLAFGTIFTRIRGFFAGWSSYDGPRPSSESRPETIGWQGQPGRIPGVK